ncbi:MAG: hypothetical protein HYY87_00225 [Candidatus Levybacteria bacterium]|nr:hypothetical protein [Candidatus Levybacteria bacterium]
MADSEPIKLSPEALERAHKEVGQPPIRLSYDALRRANLEIRQRNFFTVEPLPFRQQYLGREVQGTRVNSCTIASALLALARIGKIRGRDIGGQLNALEEELVRQAVQKGYFDRKTGDTGLANGYARTLNELRAALAAGGGGIIAYGGHARFISEEEPNGSGRFKVFDPLKTHSELVPRSFLEQNLQHFSGTTNLIVVYPYGYRPDEARGESFRAFGSSHPLVIDPERFLK